MGRKAKSRVSRRTRALTVSAILAALGVAILYLGSVIDVLDLTVCAFASMLTVLAVIELGHAYPWLIWAVTSVLSLLLLPNKLPALLYALFAGVYPMGKAAFERLHPAVGWTLKISAFNIALTAAVLAADYIFHLPDTGLALTWVVYLVGNGTFVLYDIALTRLISLYLMRIRRRLGFKDYFED